MEIRDATEHDRGSLAAIQLESWRDSYADVLGPEFLSDTLPDVLAARWAAARFEGADITLIAAPVAGPPAGFVAHLVKDEPYIYNFHLHPAARGGGTGTRLLHALAGRLLARGERSLYLHALAANRRARDYYARLGGIEDPPFEELLFGQPVTTVTLRWRDLGVLHARTAVPARAT